MCIDNNVQSGEAPAHLCCIFLVSVYRLNPAEILLLFETSFDSIYFFLQGSLIVRNSHGWFVHSLCFLHMVMAYLHHIVVGIFRIPRVQFQLANLISKTFITLY